jgi:hypothetical protein
MKANYNRHSTPSLPRGYNSFQTAWNLEAARRYVEHHVEGNETVALIYCKSTIQLQEHFDRVKELERQASTSITNDNLHSNLNAALRANRAGMPQRQPPEAATGIQYPHLKKFGAYFILLYNVGNILIILS